MPDYLIMLHPKIIHFPIALFITALGFDFLSLISKREDLHKAAVMIYVTAALLTPLVVRTGLWEEERLGLNHPILTLHRTFGLWTMWISLMSLPVLWFFKKEIPGYFRWIFLILLIVIVRLVSITAHNGGRIVYEYGVGVEK